MFPKLRAFQVNSYGWPAGPTSLPELFRWADFNATMLLQESPEASSAVDRFKKILQRDIWIFDSYSGLGTGGYTLHQQHSHMTRQNLK